MTQKASSALRPRLDLAEGAIEFVPDDGPNPKHGYVWVGDDKTWNYTAGGSKDTESRRIIRFCKQVLEFYGYRVVKP